MTVALAPIPLFEGTEFQYSSFDYLWWVLIAYFTIRLLRTDNPRWWMAIGAAVGMGLGTKYSIVFFIAGILVGVVFTSARRSLKSPWFWGGLSPWPWHFSAQFSLAGAPPVHHPTIFFSTSTRATLARAAPTVFSPTSSASAPIRLLRRVDRRSRRLLPQPPLPHAGLDVPRSHRPVLLRQGP